MVRALIPRRTSLLGAFGAALLVLFPPWQTRDDPPFFLGHAPLLMPPYEYVSGDEAPRIAGAAPLKAPAVPINDPPSMTAAESREARRERQRVAMRAAFDDVRAVRARIAWGLLITEVAVLALAIAFAVALARPEPSEGRLL